MADDVTVLREILQRELETINAYEAMLPRIADPRLRDIVEHITDEEREHVAEMYALIMERDERLQATTEKGLKHASGLFATADAEPQLSVGDIQSPAAPAPGPQGDLIPPPPPVFPSGAWSVGPLKRAR